jgi:hypothetical protein
VSNVHDYWASFEILDGHESRPDLLMPDDDRLYDTLTLTAAMTVPPVTIQQMGLDVSTVRQGTSL